MDKVDINTPRKWVGRKGFNLRFRLEIWRNIFCYLDDPRGIESNGYPMWEYWYGEPCGGVFHSKKKLQAHIKGWHESTTERNYDGTKAI